MAASKTFNLGIVIGGAVSGTVGSAFKTLEQRAEATAGKLKKLKLGESLLKDVETYKAKLLQLQAARKEGTHDTEAMNRQIGEAMAKYRAAADKARAYGLDVGRSAQEQKRLTAEIARTTTAMKRQDIMMRNRAMRRELRGQMIGAMATVYAASAPVRAALEFDEEKTRLSTLMEGEELKKSIGDALKYARGGKSLATQVELVDINYALKSADLDAAAAQAGTQIVAKVKTVTKGSAEQVAEVVGTVFNNMAESLSGNAEEKLIRIGDILTKTQFKYQIRDFGQLGESFREGTKGAIKYNVPLEQTAAILGQFNTAGLQGGRAGTSFNAMLRQMSKASDEFGFQMERNADGTLDVISTLFKLEEALQVFDDADEKADALQKVFGDEGSGVVLLLNNLKKLKDGYEEVRDASAGIVDKSYQKFLDSSSGQLKIFGNQARGAGIALSSVMLPAMNAVLWPIGQTLNTTAELADRFPLLTKVVVGTAVGLVGLKVASIGGKYALTFLSDGVQIAKGVMNFFRLSVLKTNALLTAQKAKVIGLAIWQKAGAVATWLMTAAQWAWNVAMTANPIGLIIVGVAALAAGIVWAYKKFEPFRRVVDWLWQGFKKMIQYSPVGLLIKAAKAVGVVGKVASWFGKGKEETEEKKTPKGKGETEKKTIPKIGDAIASKGTVSPALSKRIKEAGVNELSGGAAVPPRLDLEGLARGSGARTVNNNLGGITIHAAPGMDEELLSDLVAEKVADTMAEAKRHARAERRAEQYD